MAARRTPLVLLCALLALPLTLSCKGGKRGEPDIKPVSEDNAEWVATPVVGDKSRRNRRACNPALASLERLDDLTSETQLPAHYISQQLRGRGKGTTMAWIGEADERLGRVDDGQARDVALINSLIDQSESERASAPRNLVAIITQIRALVFLEMRRLLGEVVDGQVEGAEAKTAWTAAGCLFLESLTPLTQRADAIAGEDWTQSIRDAYAQGIVGLRDDIVRSKVAKQQIEKSMYGVAYRLIVAAAEERTARGANEALGLLDMIEDRLADRNGPGLARMRRAFNGPPEKIDAAMVERELAVAFTKRARKYCDKAALGGEVGQPDAIAETWEGIVYTKVILASMREALAAEGFDADAYMADWQRYLEAVEGSDVDAASEISPRLVEWNCAFQEHLKIAECSSSSNEPE